MQPLNKPADDDLDFSSLPPGPFATVAEMHMSRTPSPAREGDAERRAQGLYAAAVRAYETAPAGTCTFVCISDTHCKRTCHHLASTTFGSRLGRAECPTRTVSADGELTLPPGDVLLHAGDFCTRGTLAELESFAAWWHSQTAFCQRLLVPGNHDCALDAQYERETTEEKEELASSERLHGCGVHHHALSLLHRPDIGSFLLFDSGVTTTVAGFTVWGSPWQPAFWGAFNLPRGPQLAAKWAAIPGDTHVVVTHTPPGQGDYVPRSRARPHVGCEALARELLHRVQPAVSVFGHVHEAAGVSVARCGSGRTTVFVNAASCDTHYDAVNPPIVFQLRRSAEGEAVVRVVGTDE